MCWHVSGAAILMKLGTDCEDGGKMVIRIQPPNVGVLHIVAFNIQRRSKHDLFKSRYKLVEFHHLHNEPRKDPTEWLEYCNMLPSAVHYAVQAIRGL